MSFMMKNGLDLSPDTTFSGRERLEHWQEVVCKQYVELDCTVTKDTMNGGFYSSLRTQDPLGSIRFSEVIASPQVVDRTTSHISKSDADDFLISFQLSNDCLLRQGGRMALLRPGSFALYGSAEPYRLTFDKPFHQFILKIPGVELRRYVSDPERLVAKTYDLDGGFGPVAKEFMYTLVNEQPINREIEEGIALGASALSTNLLELLIHIMMSAQDDRLTLGASVPQEMLKKRISAFIAGNVFDPRLSNERIADAHGISLRYLYKLFAKDELSLRERIRSERLNAAHKLLMREAHKKVSIETIALHVGFSSASHFSKAFKSEFGFAPGKLRGDKRSSE